MKKLLFITSALVLTACNTTQKIQNQSANTNPKVEWDKNYGGADKSYDTQLLALREKIAPKFQKFIYKDENSGIELMYHFYIPKGYQQENSYPLVMFIPDASTVDRAELTKK